MLTLGQKIRSLRGDRSFVDFAKLTRVSHQTLFCLERGQSTKVATLKRIAKACDVKDRDWADLLILWVREELGEEDFRNLNVTPAGGKENSRQEGQPANVGQLVLSAFFGLSNLDQEQVLKVMARSTVRACLAAINNLYENPAPQEGPVSPGFPEVMENIARGVRNGDILYSTTAAPRGRMLRVRKSQAARAKRR